MQKIISLSIRLFIIISICTPIAVLYADTGKVLNIGVDTAMPQLLNPHAQYHADNRPELAMIFNSLLRYQPGNDLALEPDLATEIPKPKTVGGKQVWTFTLRKEVLFHATPNMPADEFSADDALYSLNIAADASRSVYSAAFAGMNFQKIDTNTIQITLDRPMSAQNFLPRFTTSGGAYMLSSKTDAYTREEYVQKMLRGTGPFQYAGMGTQREICLKPHQQYFRKAPMLEGVNIFYLPDIKDRAWSFQKGELDVITGSALGTWVDTAQTWKDAQVLVVPGGPLMSIIFDTQAAPLNQPKVRQTIAYALDRKAFHALYGDKVSTPLLSPIPRQNDILGDAQLLDIKNKPATRKKDKNKNSTTADFDALAGGLNANELKKLGLDYSWDIEHSLKLLQEAGYPQGFSLPQHTPEQPGLQPVYSLMAKELAAIGVQMGIHAAQPLAEGAGQPQTSNPLSIAVLPALLPQEYLRELTRNPAGVSSLPDKADSSKRYAKVDIFLDAAEIETSAKKQSDLWRHAQMKMLNDMAVYPLLSFQRVFVSKKSVDLGYTPVYSRASFPVITERTRIAD